jgi:putative PIG3 family NAD(P)H quinone oxidoreductase
MSIPESMRVVEVAEYGPPESLVTTSRPVPQFSAGEVLVKVAAAGVNRADVMQREGHYPPPSGVTDVPGLEVSGTIVAVGRDVKGWAGGQQVCALVAGGGYAEYCAVPAPQCLAVPEGVDLVEAAALPEAYFTVWTNVFDRGCLTEGETLLVHGGSSGIGTTAIALAHLMGARVFATAGSEQKCQACLDLGAALAINYRQEDFVAAVKSATQDRGVDVILDMVGGSYLPRNIDALAVEGRIVMIGLMGGAKSDINLATVMSRRLTVTGSTLRSRAVNQKAEIAASLRAHVWPHLAAKRLQPIVHATYRFDDAAEAHRVMEASTHIGKLLLVP